MNENILVELEKIKEKGLTNIELLALVSDTSYEVLFYASSEGKMRQSEELAELGIISLKFVDEIYDNIVNFIKEDKAYDSTKMNIIKASEEKVIFEYDEKKCKIYSIKKKWKAEIGV